MEDSPLSITANVTGILTFAAAILAFIYVRYKTLSNGQMEMQAIHDSVMAKLGDMQSVGLDQLLIEQGDDVDTIWLKKLFASIYAVEIVIAVYVIRVGGRETSYIIQSAADLQLVGVTPTTWIDSIREAKKASMELGPWDSHTKRLMEVLEKKYLRPLRSFVAALDSIPVRSNLVTRAVKVTLRLGTTPRLVRWYQVRKRVLEKTREREYLRSRLLSHQVSMANSSARKSNDALHRLLVQQAHLKLQIEELSRLITTTNQGLAPTESASDCDSTAGT